MGALRRGAPGEQLSLDIWPCGWEEEETTRNCMVMGTGGPAEFGAAATWRSGHRRSIQVHLLYCIAVGIGYGNVQLRPTGILWSGCPPASRSRHSSSCRTTQPPPPPPMPPMPPAAAGMHLLQRTTRPLGAAPDPPAPSPTGHSCPSRRRKVLQVAASSSSSSRVVVVAVEQQEEGEAEAWAARRRRACPPTTWGYRCTRRGCGWRRGLGGWHGQKGQVD